MSLYVLDTDTLSLFQEGHPDICRRALAVPADALAITVLSVEEQLSGWYTELRKAKDRERLAWAYQRLAQNVRFLSRLQIFDFDEPAIRRYDDLRRLKLKVRRTDLQIATIVLEHQATVVTCNVRDFKRIPGLRLEDWSK
jgi:tRNA(fMet)-specific endonuclease VapC